MGTCILTKCCFDDDNMVMENEYEDYNSTICDNLKNNPYEKSLGYNKDVIL